MTVQCEGWSEFLRKTGKVVVCDPMTKKGKTIDKRFEIVPVKNWSTEAQLLNMFHLTVSYILSVPLQLNCRDQGKLRIESRLEELSVVWIVDRSVLA